VPSSLAPTSRIRVPGGPWAAMQHHDHTLMRAIAARLF
jgi:hypothetical protein